MNWTVQGAFSPLRTDPPLRDRQHADVSPTILGPASSLLSAPAVPRTALIRRSLLGLRTLPRPLPRISGPDTGPAAPPPRPRDRPASSSCFPPSLLVLLPATKVLIASSSCPVLLCIFHLFHHGSYPSSLRPRPFLPRWPERPHHRRHSRYVALAYTHPPTVIFFLITPQSYSSYLLQALEPPALSPSPNPVPTYVSSSARPPQTTPPETP